MLLLSDLQRQIDKRSFHVVFNTIQPSSNALPNTETKVKLVRLYEVGVDGVK